MTEPAIVPKVPIVMCCQRAPTNNLKQIVISLGKQNGYVGNILESCHDCSPQPFEKRPCKLDNGPRGAVHRNEEARAEPQQISDMPCTVQQLVASFRKGQRIMCSIITSSMTSWSQESRPAQVERTVKALSGKEGRKLVRDNTDGILSDDRHKTVVNNSKPRAL